MTDIVYHPVADILPPQKRHVHERHAPGAVAEDEKIAGQRERRRPAQIEPAQTSDDPLVHGPLARAVYPRIDVSERMGLRDEPFADRPVIDRTQHAHIKRDGVAHHAPPPEPLSVLLHETAVEPVHRKGFPGQKGVQAVPRPQVVARRAEPAALGEPLDLPPQVVRKGDAPSGRAADLRPAAFDSLCFHTLSIIASKGRNYIPFGPHPSRLDGKEDGTAGEKRKKEGKDYS